MTGGITGAQQRLHFLWEDNGYGSSPNDSTAKIFGHDAVLTTSEATNNGTRIRLPASETAVVIKEGSFDGAWAVTFALSTPWWLRTLYGAPSTTDNSDGSYTHTYSGVDPTPIRILVGYEPTTDVRTLKGCVPTQASIDPTVDENTTAVTLEGFYQTEEVTSPGSLTTQPTPADEPLDYGDADLKVAGTSRAIVQNASLTLPLNTTTGIRGFGSRFFIDYVDEGSFDPELSYTEVDDDTDSLDEIYGGSTSMQEDIADDDAVTLSWDNGNAAGSGINQITANATGTFPESFAETGTGDPTSRIEEELGRLITDVTFDATNETATAP